MGMWKTEKKNLRQKRSVPSMAQNGLEKGKKRPLNNRLTLRRLFGGSGFSSPRSLAFPRLLHPHTSPPQTYGLLYKVGWYVVNLERYVQYDPNNKKYIDKRNKV